ncbi:MAG: hypothetical protein ABI415_02865 [Flavitalea sp.]
MHTANHLPVFAFPVTQSRTNPLNLFFTWCAGQENNRLLWLGIALVGHSAVLTPLTMSVILLTQFNFTLLMITLFAISISVVTNLAALPTKITLPVLFLSVLIDLGVMLFCLVNTTFN